MEYSAAWMTIFTSYNYKMVSSKLAGSFMLF